MMCAHSPMHCLLIKLPSRLYAPTVGAVYVHVRVLHGHAIDSCTINIDWNSSCNSSTSLILTYSTRPTVQPGIIDKVHVYFVLLWYTHLPISVSDSPLMQGRQLLPISQLRTTKSARDNVHLCPSMPLCNAVSQARRHNVAEQHLLRLYIGFQMIPDLKMSCSEIGHQVSCSNNDHCDITFFIISAGKCVRHLQGTKKY